MDVGDAGGVLEAPAIGSFGFRFSRVSHPTISAAHTDLEYSENHARDGGASVSLRVRGHGEYRLRATVRRRQARFPGSPSASGPSVPGLPRSGGRVLSEPGKSTQRNGLRKAEVTTRFVTKVEVRKVFGGVGRHTGS